MKPSARRRHARIVQDVLAVLVEKYPRCFSLTDDERKPLALGIGGTIIAQHPELKPANIRPSFELVHPQSRLSGTAGRGRRAC
jgi:hypothetical protein